MYHVLYTVCMYLFISYGLFLIMYMSIYLGEHAHDCSCLCRPEALGPTGTRVTGGCELSDVGAGNPV